MLPVPDPESRHLELERWQVITQCRRRVSSLLGMDLNRECKGLGSEAQFRAQQLTGPTPKGPDLHAARAGPAEQLKGGGRGCLFNSCKGRNY